jgi:hypothetical protein
VTFGFFAADVRTGAVFAAAVLAVPFTPAELALLAGFAVFTGAVFAPATLRVAMIAVSRWMRFAQV